MLLSKFKIAGHSMQPTFKNGDAVLVSNIPFLFKKPKLNDMVAFEEDGGKILIKRITKITKNGFFLQGDNKADSLDSRKFGMISKDKILGKVIYKF